MRFMVGLVVMLMLGSVNWMMVDWHSDNMRLDDDGIWDFDGNVDGIWNFNFFNNWHFNLLVDGELLGVMMMDGVDFVGNFNLDGFTMEIKFMISNSPQIRG